MSFMNFKEEATVDTHHNGPNAFIIQKEATLPQNPIRNVTVQHPTVMEGTFPQNAYLRIIIQTSSLRTIIKISLRKNDNKFKGNQTGYAKQKLSASNYEILQTSVNDLLKCSIKNIIRFNTILIGGTFLLVLYFGDISMLKRSYSMEFDSDQYKTDSAQIASSVLGKETDENVQISKKICNSSSYEEGKSLGELDVSSENNRSSSHGRAESYRRYSQSGENAHVTQSRSIFSHEDSFVYGNPKEDIKSIENPPVGDSMGTRTLFENNSSSALDLSCKGPKIEEERSDGNNTYQNYQRSDSSPRTNLEIKLVNPSNKKPSLPEQLQIAKIQQQQRRSMQQQQKLLQQMRRSLDPKSSNRQDACQSSHKNVKYYGNNTTNHEQNDLDNHARVKDEFHPPIPGAHFQQFPYPYFDPTHPKELPDNHPILPLLDPVYFSALYNAHGFLPPSSPSIAAAFIGTLQDALPKLSMMFPSTSSSNSPLLPQKGNENPN